jgi:predicted membrane channel-forming protein YqfA (hemolysin III family)
MKLHIFNKIDFKKFFLISILPSAISIFFAIDNNEILAMGVIYIATVVYLFMFSEAIYEVTDNTKEKTNKRIVSFLLIGKLVILIGALIFGVQIMGKRIIIPVLNYIIHIFVLYISMKKKGS